jgi:diacylglycerol O-acyltransferase
MAVVPLHTDIADPMARLDAVQESTKAAKEYGVDAQTMAQASDALPGALIGTAQRAVARLITRTGRVAGAHTIVTNVPGPRTPTYFCGARTVMMSGMAPIVDGMGLIIGIGSYLDQLYLCWTADRNQMPDTAFFRECLRTEAELLSASVPAGART